MVLQALALDVRWLPPRVPAHQLQAPQLLREICQVAYHLGCQQLRSRIVERQSTWEGGPNEHAGVGWKWCTRRIGEGRGVMRALAGACAVRRRRCRLTLHLATVRAWEATTSELSHTKSRPEHRVAPCARVSMWVGDE